MSGNPLDQPESPTPSHPPLPADDAHSKPAGPVPLAIEGGATANSLSPEPQEEVHTLDVGEGNVVKLDKLGPMIINSDGTLSRIQNWQDLHPIEQERTVRLLVKKRNLVRLRRLDGEAKAEGEGGEALTALEGDKGGEGR